MVFLIVEDSPRMRASIKQFLSTRVPDHHTVFEASDGAEAIDVFNREHPDWVFMDIMMEPMDGLTASRKIMEANAEARIIILTNYDDDSYRRAAKAAGVQAFILKENLNQIPEILRKSL